MSGRWIFGYGSLVNPVSFGFTLGRPLTPTQDFHYAVLDGFGRRWNYGVGHVKGWVGAREVSIVALGLVAAAGETANGIVAWVDDAELARLDHRERDYDRVEVTGLVDATVALDGHVETYVPRTAAVDRYEAARAAGTGVIEQRYWDLVSGAFAAFGASERYRYFETTPKPDVPVMEVDTRAPARLAQTGQDLSANGD